MVQALLLKAIISGVMKAIEKAPDKKIAKNHEKRIKKLEKLAHPKTELICKCCKEKESK
jgi:TPP-dependent indolepyruvate ferredoxin oxidoreductase alpha subunit